MSGEAQGTWRRVVLFDAVTHIGWRAATEQALYGSDGFYRREAPGGHFRTSVHATPAFAHALARLADDVGARVVVDVGAGRGELLTALHDARPRLELIGVEVAARPENLTAAVDWTDAMPSALDDVLVVANEWLDNIPVDVAELDDDGVVRLVLVDPATGGETLGETRWRSRRGLAGHVVAARQRSEPGSRAEIGWPRDDAWAGLVAAVRSGALIAADYAHVRDDRPPFGTLAGYRGGQLVQPVPDGSCDVTSHVALDACAEAGARAEVDDTVLTTQRRALRALGVSGRLPPRELALAQPREYAAALQHASRGRGTARRRRSRRVRLARPEPRAAPRRPAHRPASLRRSLRPAPSTAPGCRADGRYAPAPPARRR